MEQVDIERLLRDTFSGNRAPKAVILESGDGRGTVAEDFAGRRWSELPSDFVVANDETFSRMKPEARSHYLPAFLLAVFQAPADWVFTNNILLELFIPLRRPEGDPARQGFEKFLMMLSEAQKAAVRTFLEYVAEHHASEGERGAAKMALRLLWSKF